MLGPIRLETQPRANDRPNGANIRVLVAHHPSVFDRAVDASVHVVLAGHLHDG